MMGGMPGQAAPPHQLTALNNYLLHLDTATPPSSLPPFSMVSRIGVLCHLMSRIVNASVLHALEEALEGAADVLASIEWAVQWERHKE